MLYKKYKKRLKAIIDEESSESVDDVVREINDSFDADDLTLDEWDMLMDICADIK